MSDLARYKKIVENANFDFGLKKDASRTTPYPVRDYNFKGRADIKNRYTPSKSGDQAMATGFDGIEESDDDLFSDDETLEEFFNDPTNPFGSGPNDPEKEYDPYKIASEWHGGQGSALYSFSSTGKIYYPEDLKMEIEHCIKEVENNSAYAENKDDLLDDLYYLQNYVEEEISSGNVENTDDDIEEDALYSKMLDEYTEFMGEDETDDLENMQPENQRFTYTRDALGDVTIRDNATGQEKYFQGTDATELLSYIEKATDSRAISRILQSFLAEGSDNSGNSHLFENLEAVATKYALQHMGKYSHFDDFDLLADAACNEIENENGLVTGTINRHTVEDQIQDEYFSSNAVFENTDSETETPFLPYEKYFICDSEALAQKIEHNAGLEMHREYNKLYFPDENTYDYMVNRYKNKMEPGKITIAKSENNLEEANNFGLDNRNGKFVFPWTVDDQSGTAEAIYSRGDARPNLEIRNIIDSDGNDIDVDQGFLERLNTIALEYIGNA